MTDPRFDALQQWLNSLPDIHAIAIEPASSDASFRRYFRITEKNRTIIAMDAPPEKEDIEPFIDIARRLQNQGVHVPRIIAINNDQGYLLLEDLGDMDYLDSLKETNADKLYRDAIDSLLCIQSADTTDLPEYDQDLLLEEMDLFSTWFLDVHLRLQLSKKERHDLDEVYLTLATSALEQPTTFTHRDYHSRNLMVINTGNPGVIDFQDAVNGPFSYDLVSLLRDCYITWPTAQIEQWQSIYLKKYLENNPGKCISNKQFASWFDLMGVQRHLKAIGIFARLSHRDNKHCYIDDIPRTLAYITSVGQLYPLLEPLLDIIKRYDIEAGIQS